MDHDVRRFPLPWKIEADDSCFWVEDAEGKRFGYTYFHEGAGGIGSSYGQRLTRSEAFRIVRNIVKLPSLVKR